MSPTGTAERISTQRVEIVLSQLRDLPSLPPVVTKLLRLTGDSDADIREVISLIETDPPLAAKLLSMTRKAAVGAGGQISTVEKAVLLLGMKVIRNLVLAAEVRGVFSSGEHEDDADRAFVRSEFWKHCLAVGCAAELLAPHVKSRVHPDEAFICGLLHDLGKIALDTIMPKSYERVHRINASRQGSLADVEREIIGVDHMVVGKRIGQQWELPESITVCLWLHHHPPDALPDRLEHADLVRAVHAADALVREMRLGLSGNYLRNESSERLSRALGVSEEAHARVRRELAGRIEQRAELIDVKELSTEKLYLEALSQANRELGKLNESLSVRNRELESRSRLLEAVATFSQGLLPSDTPAHACQGAARALRSVLSARSVVVCSVPDAEGIYHLGMCDGDDDSSESHVVTSPDTAGKAASPVGQTPGPAARSRTLPEYLAKASVRLGGEPTWMHSITCGGQVVGAVLARAEPGRESASGCAEDCSLLLSAVGMALSNTKARESAQRLAEDLSESNRRLHESQQLLLRQRTIRMIAEMASGAAHELNNPLAVISGRAQMLAGETDPQKVRSVVGIIHEQAHRCSQIVTELLQFACPQQPQAQECKLRDLLTVLRQDVLERYPTEPERLHLEISDARTTVWADPKQIQRALEELIQNAFDAMSEDEPRLHINCSGDPADDKVIIAIRDNGRGMSADVQQRAFDPFFSDRPAGRGRGLGLCHAYRMVEMNGGQLRLESTPGVGTTALISLPSSPPKTPG